MTTTIDQIRELSEALDRDVENALQRASQAEESLRLAQAECEAANKAVIQVQQQRDGYRHTFAEVLGIEVNPEPKGDLNPEVDPEPEPEPRLSLQLVLPAKPPAAANDPVVETPKAPSAKAPSAKAPSAKTQAKKIPDFAELSMAEKLRHIIGERTMTLDEIRDALKARKLVIEHLSHVLSKSKHKVLDAHGQPMRDPKTAAWVKQNTFVSVGRGSWKVAVSEHAEAEPEPPLAVLSKSEVQAEMLRNSTLRVGVRRV